MSDAGRSPRGIVLILVSALLAMLIMLAVLLAGVREVERKGAAHTMDATRARLSARSGTQRAIAEMARGADPAYLGEDWNGSGALDGDEGVYEVYRPGTLDRDGCPVSHAMSPSFFSRADGNTGPGGEPISDWTWVNGRKRGFSGRLRGTRADRTECRGDHYVLRVGRSGGVHVNGGDLTSAGEHADTYDTTLKRILGNLAVEVGVPLGRVDGEALVTARPAGGWSSWEALRDGALGGSEAKLDAIRPYLTLHAWVDKKVVVPNAEASLVSVSPYSWGEIRTGTRDDLSATGMRRFNPRTNSYAPDFERDTSGAIVGRAPVDLNWAIAHPEALRALLTGLEGVFLLEQSALTRSYQTYSPRTRMDEIGRVTSVALLPVDVDAVVAALQGHTGFVAPDNYPGWDGTSPFDGWEEFATFVERKLPTLSREKRDLLLANFNPNTAPNKFNPNRSFFTAVDKADLRTYSTEFCFRAMHEVEVESFGRHQDTRGALLAGHLVRIQVRGAEHVRFTAQSEFVAGDGGLGRLDEAGDETNFRAPGAADFLATYAGEGGVQGFGAKFLGTEGLALQTHPEPQWGAGSPVPAAWDGNIQLATLETPASESGLTFLASWGSEVDADVAPGGRNATKDTLQVAGEDGTLGTSVWGRASASPFVNTIHPDGLYSEQMRAPGYLAAGNLDGMRAAVSFWAKANYDLSLTRQGSMGRGHMHLNLSHLILGGTPTVSTHTQMFWLGPLIYDADRVRGWYGFWSVRHAQMDTGLEHWIRLTESPVPHRWQLMTFFYNLPSDSSATYAALLSNDAVGAERNHQPETYSGLVAAGGDNLTAADGYEADNKHRFYLGYRGYGMPDGSTSWPGYYLADADATLDEFAFYNNVATPDDCRTLAMQRYKDGRYYKGTSGSPVEDAVYTSAWVPMLPGTVLLGAEATCLLPRYQTPDTSIDPDYVFHKGAKRSGAGIRIVDTAGTEHDTFPVSLPDGRFRYKVEIFPNVENPDDPLLNSPVFDDVTFRYTPPSGVRIVSWEEPVSD